jgi:hypothetical protein
VWILLNMVLLVEELEAIASWLSPSLNFGERHRDILNTRVAGTGDWFLKLDKVKKWCAGQGNVKSIRCKGGRK